jgi:hypothetical protein
MSMGIIAVSAMVVSAGVGIYGANKNAGIAKDAADAARIERDQAAGCARQGEGSL